MCEIQPCLYLISCSDSNWFKPCKVDLITRHTSTPGVSYGNLSQAHKQIFHVAPIPRCLCIPTNTRLWVGCVSAWPQFLALSVRGYIQKGARHFQSEKYCKLRRFTVAHKHGMWLVLSIADQMDSLERALIDRRGYATKEAGSAVHFPVSGPIGLARS